MNVYKPLVNKKNYGTRLLFKTKEDALQYTLDYIKMSYLNPEYDILCKPEKIEKDKDEPYYVVEKYKVLALYASDSDVDLGIEGYYEETFIIHIIEYTIL